VALPRGVRRCPVVTHMVSVSLCMKLTCVERVGMDLNCRSSSCWAGYQRTTWGNMSRHKFWTFPFIFTLYREIYSGIDFSELLPHIYQMQVLQQLILENRQAGEGLGSISSLSSLPPPFPSCVRPWRTHHDARACFVLHGRSRARQTREGERGGAGVGGWGGRERGERARARELIRNDTALRRVHWRNAHLHPYSNANHNVQTLIPESANRAREGEGAACAKSSARSHARRLSGNPLNSGPLSLTIIPSFNLRLNMAATARASTTGASVGGGSGGSGCRGVLGRYFRGGMLEGVYWEQQRTLTCRACCSESTASQPLVNR
jgi:hypothetical protein